LAEAARRHLIEIAPAEAHVGDVILFRWKRDLPAKHAGILSAPHTFIHAYDGAAVTESPLSDWWRRRIAYAFAFPGAGD
jgi:NlpC/P60 family putative phage cell wall peptidase